MVDAGAGAVAPCDGGRDPFAALPLALLQRILALLPAHERARACAVCVRWRDALAELHLWTTLDFSYLNDREAGDTRLPKLLHGAVGRARGGLVVLNADVGDPYWYVLESLSDDLLAVARANSATLRELRWAIPLTAAAELEQLLRAAPRLITLRVGLDEHENVAAAARMLRGEPPFNTPALHLMFCSLWARNDADALALAAALAEPVGPPIEDLVLYDDAQEFGANAFEALVRALISRRVEMFSSMGGLGHACAPALARLLRDSTALKVSARWTLPHAFRRR